MREDDLQILVMNYLRYQYPNALFFHTPNGGYRNPLEAKKMKRMGVLPGVPDIIIANPNKNFNGLCIELKIKPNKPTENQLEVIGKFENIKWKVNVCYDFDSAKETIDNYFKNN